MNEISLMLRVNDEKTGAFLGRVDQIHIGDDLMDLEGPSLECRTERVLKLVLGDLRFALKSYACCVGNWCWDRALLEIGHLPRLLQGLMDHGWDCIEAESSLFEMWQRGKVPTVEQLSALLIS